MGSISEELSLQNIGTWEGTIEVGEASLEVRLHASEKQYLFDCDSQNVRQIPTELSASEDGVVKIDIDLIKGNFDGKLDENRESMSGQWYQNGHTCKMSLSKVGE